MAELVRSMVTNLVDLQDELVVWFEERDRVVVITVTAAASDVGKVIGKQGRMARALRTVIEAAGAKVGVRCELNIATLTASVAVMAAGS